MAEGVNHIVAIDIGTSNIVTLVGERAEQGKLRIVGSAITPSVGMARGDVRNVEQIVASINQSLAEIVDKYDIKISEAYVSLSGEHLSCSLHSGYVFITTDDSEVSRKDVEKLSESMFNVKVDAGQAIIHILPQNYILDGDNDILQPVGMIGKKLEGRFNIVLGRTQNLKHLERCLNRSQVALVDVVLSSLASSESLLLDDEKELGVVVVDIGGGTTDVCIYYDKTIRYMGVVPIGGNLINKDIKEFGVLERNVEKLKMQFGSALSSLASPSKVITLTSVNNLPSKEIPQKVLASIIEARMMDIVEAVKDIIDKSGYSDRIKGPIVLTGGCSLLKDVDKLFALHLNREIRVASPTLYLTDDSIELVKTPQYSTAVGVLLRGSEIGKGTKTAIVKKPKPVAPKVDRAQSYQEDRNTTYQDSRTGGYQDGRSDGYQEAAPSRYQEVRPTPRVQSQQDTTIYGENNKLNKQQAANNTPVNSHVDNVNYDDIDDSKDLEYDTHDGDGKQNWFKSLVQKTKEIFDPEDLEDDTL